MVSQKRRRSSASWINLIVFIFDFSAMSLYISERSLHLFCRELEPVAGVLLRSALAKALYDRIERNACSSDGKADVWSTDDGW
ncbi:MAG TPA: hypothetical protein VH591_09530 [Ktedonobacterales bacterium]